MRYGNKLDLAVKGTMGRVAAGILLGLSLPGCVQTRPEPLGIQPREEAARALAAIRELGDTSLASIGLRREALGGSKVGKDSLLYYHVPIGNLRKLAGTEKFDEIPINSYTMVFPVQGPDSAAPVTGIMVQQLKKDRRWVMTRFGQSNLIRAMDATRRRFARATGREDGYYIVAVPYLFKYYVAWGAGEKMAMLEVESERPDGKFKTPMAGAEVFRTLKAESDSMPVICKDTPEKCKGFNPRGGVPVMR